MNLPPFIRASLKTSSIAGTLAIASFSILTTTAHANNFNYNYAQIGYSAVNDFDVDGGITVSGSYDVQENVNLFGEFFVSTSSDSDIADDIDVDIYTFGVGYHTPISDKTDILVDIGLFNTNAEATTGSISIERDDSGYELGLGARHKLTEKVEVNARGEHKNSDNLTDTTYTLGARYHFNPAISAGIDFNTGADDGSETITTSLRWNFK